MLINKAKKGNPEQKQYLTKIFLFIAYLCYDKGVS